MRHIPVRVQAPPSIESMGPAFNNLGGPESSERGGALPTVTCRWYFRILPGNSRKPGEPLNR